MRKWLVSEGRTTAGPGRESRLFLSKRSVAPNILVAPIVRVPPNDYFFRRKGASGQIELLEPASPSCLYFTSLGTYVASCRLFK